MHRTTKIVVGLISSALFFTPMTLADDDHHHEEHDKKAKNVRVHPTFAAPEDLTYKKECGSCHMVFPPGLLPGRSWQALMKGLDNHFGETASLDGKIAEKITQFLVEHSAEHSAAKKSKKILKYISPGETPLRFSETKYFKREHDEIGPGVWKRKAVVSRANCIACHPQAESGDFSEDNIRIPK